jgi:hypothetical protein
MAISTAATCSPVSRGHARLAYGRDRWKLRGLAMLAWHLEMALDSGYEFAVDHVLGSPVVPECCRAIAAKPFGGVAPAREEDGGQVATPGCREAAACPDGGFVACVVGVKGDPTPRSDNSPFPIYSAPGGLPQDRGLAA